MAAIKRRRSHHIQVTLTHDRIAPTMRRTMARIAGRIGWVFRPILPLLLTTAILTLGFAPIKQFYFAWIGLVPWLIFISLAQSQKSAFLYSWIGGFIFFTANMWWMAFITIPGMFALMLYCGLYWGIAA